MPKQIRVAIDILVEKGDADEVARLVAEEREAIGNFISHTIVPADDRGEGVKLKTLAGGAHEHEVEGSYCDMCDRYSRKQILVPVE